MQSVIESLKAKLENTEEEINLTEEAIKRNLSYVEKSKQKLHGLKKAIEILEKSQ